MEILAFLFLGAAAVGLAAIAAQHLVLWAHVRQAPRVPRRTPAVSILKPLCGVDDELEANLASFAVLDYPEYEVVLALAWVPVKDLLYAAAWLHGFVRRDVVWRGTRIRVARGTRIERPASAVALRVEGGATAAS